MSVDFQRDVSKQNCPQEHIPASNTLLDQACRDAYQPKEKDTCSTSTPKAFFDMCSWRPDYSLSSQSARDWQRQSDINRTKPIELTKCDIYTVKYGDCLWTIAERDLKKNGEKTDAHSIKNEIDKIVKLNEKEHPSLKCNPDLILPGWKLKMPDHCKDNDNDIDCKPPEKPHCRPHEHKPPEHKPPKCHPEEPKPPCHPEQPKPPCPPEQPPPPCPPEQPPPPCPPEQPPPPCPPEQPKPPCPTEQPKPPCPTEQPKPPCPTEQP
ncbi:MAG: LysM peptidoglycan-binding domain-containing protein, partial [Cyanobacteria bacterium SZAS LIN-5]|nr:LysM peptidoglycan-binding domain-containing protein [Cyanobacteria bacterium SZAS LIN-5]